MTFLFLANAMLFASMFTPDAASEETEEMLITIDTTWAGNQNIDMPVRVQEGATLSIHGSTIVSDEIIIEPGSALIIEGSILDASHISIEDGVLDIKNSTLEIQNSLYLVNGTSHMSNSTMKIEMVTSNGTIHMENCTFTGVQYPLNFYYYTEVFASWVSIYRCDIAMRLFNSKAFISNWTVNHTSWAILGSEMELEARDCSFISTGDALVLYSSTVEIYNCTMSGADGTCYGVQGCGSVPAQGRGVVLYDSRIAASDSSFNSNFLGFEAFFSTIILEDCVLDGNYHDGIYAEESKIYSNGTRFSNNSYAIYTHMRPVEWARNPALWGTNMFFGNNYSYRESLNVAIQVNDTAGRGIFRATVILSGTYVNETDQFTFNSTRTTNRLGMADFNIDHMEILDNGTIIIWDMSMLVEKEGVNATSPVVYTHSQSLNLSTSQSFFVSLPLLYPELELSNIRVTTTGDGKSLEIHLNVANVGQGAVFGATITAVERTHTGLRTDIGEQSINLTAGETLELNFLWGSPEAGKNYTIIIEAEHPSLIVGDEFSNVVLEKSFQVTENTTGFPIHLLIAVIIIAGGALFFVLSLFRRKPKTKDQGPDVGMKL
ncbi:MAG: hypothetical protein QCI38_06100 [Candidatus Thermoplasmatota archaeon]|nr:hypothetical protein [Candidatus Thermoplasmatota archaeon]